MPVTKQTAAGGATQFNGTANRGLFTIGGTGGQSIQARINSISFSTGGAITDWTLNLVDPSDGQVIELLSDTTTNLALGGPGGFMLIPTNSDGVSWNLTFSTTGMAASGTINVDVDFQDTES